MEWIQFGFFFNEEKIIYKSLQSTSKYYFEKLFVS